MRRLGGLAGKKFNTKPRNLHRRRLTVEVLEDRRLLAAVPWSAPFGPVEPLGSLIYDSQAEGDIRQNGEVDRFSVELDAGQTVTVVAEPGASVRPRVKLMDSTGMSLGLVTAAS